LTETQDELNQIKSWKPAEEKIRWLQTVQTDLTWLGYMVFTAGVVYCHNTAVLFPLGINLFVIGLMIWQRFFPGGEKDLQPPSIMNWLWAQIGAVLVWSPWLGGFIIQAAGVLGEFWIPKPTLQIVMSTLQSFFSDGLPQRFTIQGWIWWFFGALLGLGFLFYRKTPTKTSLLSTLFSLWRPIFYVRTLIYAPISLYLLMAAGIRQLRFRPMIAGAILLLAGVNSLSLKEFYFTYQKEAWDQAASFVAQNGRDGDIILFNAGWTQIPFDYYFTHYQKPWEKFGAPQTMFEFGVLEPIMREQDVPRLRRILQGRQRVWLVYSHYWYTDPDQLVIGTLSEERKLVKQAHFYGIDIYLFETR
jgi:hypothetical protein